MEITIIRQDGNWIRGRVEGLPFEAKVFERPSEYGIPEWDYTGKISKLWIGSRNFGTVACYDRGWDKLPSTDREIEVTQAVIDRFN